MRDVGQYYVHHLHATASTAELFARGLERALGELDAGHVESFARRLSRLRRSLRLETRHGAVAAALLRAFVGAARAARGGDPEGARRKLSPLLEAARG
jgi:hypothetical protein